MTPRMRPTAAPTPATAQRAFFRSSRAKKPTRARPSRSGRCSERAQTARAAGLAARGIGPGDPVLLFVPMSAGGGGVGLGAVQRRAVRERAQGPGEEEVLLERGLLLLGDQALGGLEHHGAVAAVGHHRRGVPPCQRPCKRRRPAGPRWAEGGWGVTPAGLGGCLHLHLHHRLLGRAGPDCTTANPGPLGGAGWRGGRVKAGFQKKPCKPRGWWAFPGSNRGPSDYESRALTN